MLSYFAGDALGSHQLDTGVEYHKLREATSVYTPGGYEVQYLNNAYWNGALPDGNGDGLVDYLLYRDYPAEIARDPVLGKADGWSAFVQDQWRPTPQLTVNLGLRYESMVHTNTVGETVADFQKWLPRLGVAWDIGGRGRHVLRAGWNRYMHPGVTNMSWMVPGSLAGPRSTWASTICAANTASATGRPPRRSSAPNSCTWTRPATSTRSICTTSSPSCRPKPWTRSAWELCACRTAMSGLSRTRRRLPRRRRSSSPT